MQQIMWIKNALPPLLVGENNLLPPPEVGGKKVLPLPTMHNRSQMFILQPPLPSCRVNFVKQIMLTLNG